MNINDNTKDGGLISLPAGDYEIVQLYGDGINDDAPYFNALKEGRIIARIDSGTPDGKPGQYIARASNINS